MKKYLFTILAMATVMVACETEINGPIDPIETPEVAVSLSGSVPGLTRVSSDNAGIYKFQENDEITVITDNNTMRNFTAAPGAGETASFEGTIPQGEFIVAAFYPASEYESYAVNKFYVPTNIVWKQDASNMPMYATVVTTQEEGKYSAEFKAVGGVLKLVCFNVPENATKMVFTAATQKIAGEFTITKDNNDKDQIVGSTSEVDNSITFDFTGNRSDNMVFYVPLPVVTLTGGFTIAFKDADKELISIKSGKAAEITRNKLLIAPSLNCAIAAVWKEDFSGYSANDVPTGGLYSYECVDGGSDTKVYNDALAGGSKPELLVGKNGGYFTAGSINTGGAQTLTLKYKTNAKTLNVSSSTAGVTINPSNNGNSAGEHTATVTNANGANTISLTFTAPSSDNVRLDDIVLSLNGQDITNAPTITADATELIFSVGETSKEVTVGLDNEIDGLGISAVLTGKDSSKFTASISGFTLTVTPEAANTDAEDYTATITLKATGASYKTIAVTQLSSLVPNPTDLAAESGDKSATVTWTKDANATSYKAYLCTSETETPATSGTDVSGNIDVTGNSCSLELTGLTNTQPYYLYVKVYEVAENYSSPETFVSTSFTPVAAKELVSIAVTTAPTKTSYNVGEKYSFAGAVVTATYNDESTDDVTSECTTDYDGETFTISDLGQKTVTVTYTPDPTKTTTFNITVSIVDVLTRATTGVTSGSTSYSPWSGKSKDEQSSGINSAAVYAGNSAGGNDAIQLRSKNSNSGVVTTTSGGYVRKISVSWQSSTTDNRTLNVYGKDNTYTAATDLYDTKKQGTLLGTIVKGTSTELTVSGNYEYIGLRSDDGAMYLSEIRIAWEPGSPTIAIAKTSITGVVAAGVDDASESDVYTFKNGATDADVTVTCDGAIVTAASKNNGSITYSVAANTGASREGWIKVQYGTEEAHTVTVNQNAATYTLTLSNDGNGAVSATVDNVAVESGDAVAFGKIVSITTTPNGGYELATLLYNAGGADVDIKSTKSFEMPANAVTVSATFTEISTIGILKSAITDVPAAGVTDATESGVYSFYGEATDDDITVTCDGTIVTAASKNNGAITYSVAENTGAARNGWVKVQYGSEDPHEITVSQLSGAAGYTLTLSSGGNLGTIKAYVDNEEVSSGSTIDPGKTVTITPTANTGCAFISLKYNDGSDHDITSAKSFTMPSANVTVTAVFAHKYTLTPDQTSTGRSETSYITSLTEFTYNNVSWEMNQWNPKTLQVKCNQSSAASEFRFYNSSAFSGRIIKVVVTFSALTVSDSDGFMFKGGSSAVYETANGTSGTWNSTSKTITWTPGATDNFTFFAFYQNGKVATGTNSLASSDAIVVYYE